MKNKTLTMKMIHNDYEYDGHEVDFDDDDEDDDEDDEDDKQNKEDG